MRMFLKSLICLATLTLLCAVPHHTEAAEALPVSQSVTRENYPEGSQSLLDLHDDEKTLLDHVRFYSGSAFVFFIVVMLVLTQLDHMNPRKLCEKAPFTVIVPCYNDGDSVGETIASVFKAYPSELLELIVINDCSRDDSLVRIEECRKRFDFRVIDNEINRGKARSLNDAVTLASNDIVLFLDADTVLNRPAIVDMLSRLESDPRLGAVSCPYRPRNRGFLPAMQAVEYCMLLLTQGAHNLISAMALWGGCLMVRKAAFVECGGFNVNAITEDVDLAFRLNRKKWRVEQSFRPIRCLVPDTLRGWIRQKLRWTSGGTQCYFRHFSVWVRNPIQIFFILSYSLFVASTVPMFYEGIEIGGALCHIWDGDVSIWQNLLDVNKAFGADLLQRIGRAGLCLAISSIYVFPLIRRVRDIIKLLWVLPFSLLYFPAYMILSLFGMAIGIRSLTFPKKSDTCGWKTT